MKKRVGIYNPKRRMAPQFALSEDERKLLARKAKYEGSPDHKLRPGDYGLTPSRSPRPGKSLCDANSEFPKARSARLLRDGIKRGLISEQYRNEWPQNVWSVANGEPYEALLTNRDSGTYHGYPMPLDDDFREVVLKEWKLRE